VTELSRQAEVDIWHPHAADPRATVLKTVPFQRIGPSELAQLAAYDLVVYNLGNHFPYHREIVPLAARIRGVSILHDLVMHHYFAAYYFEELKDGPAYVRLIRTLYGEEGRQVAEAAVAGKRRHIWESDDLLRYPLFEEAVRGSYGVITHSAYQRAAVQKQFPGPVGEIPLAYKAVPPAKQTSRKELGVPAEHILIVTIGYLNPNKRIHAVIEALAREPDLESKVTYTVVGSQPPGYYDQLRDLVRRHRLEKAVRFIDYAPDEMLRAYLLHGDICVNLRYPATEGASASLIEQMQCGKAVVVTDTASYSELPDDCVLKVAHDREAQELPAALRRLAFDEPFRIALGRKAQQYATHRFHPARYVEHFLQFASEVRRDKPLLQFADRLASELNRMGVHAGMAINDAVSEECRDLFGDVGDESR
jgi:glycosyltransferase involved in cell wall biosynthesis